ncbi:MAG: hypothetical protein WD278_03875 [Pirellulales bacterium]
MAKKLPGNKEKKKKLKKEVAVRFMDEPDSPQRSRACSQIGSPPQGGLRSGVCQPRAG